MQFLFTSFDVCWAGDQLVKFLSGEEPGKFGVLANLTFIQTGIETHWLKVPAEVILLSSEAVVDVANQ